MWFSMLQESDRVVDGEIEQQVSTALLRIWKHLSIPLLIYWNVHGIINNAGIIRDGLLVKKDHNARLRVLSNKYWKQVLDVNLTGVFLGARAYADWRIKNNKRKGHSLHIRYKTETKGNPASFCCKSWPCRNGNLWAGELGEDMVFERVQSLQGLPEHRS